MPKNTKKEEKNKINISKYIKRSEELVKLLKELKEKKKLFFHIYDGLKGFDLIMTVIGKEKIIEYFTGYMKDTSKDSKNYGSFVSFIGENKGKEFFEGMRKVYNDILENYDKIKFSNDSFHFGSEEIYLRETLEKIKSVLDSLGELEGKGKFININLSFLNLKNSNLDFNFTDSELQKIDFFTSLEESLEEDNYDDNKLLFFHLMNKLMGDLKLVQERVLEMSNDFKKEIRKDIESLYGQEKEKEIEFIEKSQKQIISYLNTGNLDVFSDISIEINSILDNLERNKELIQSIIRKDIETLENSLEDLDKVI